MSEVITKGCRNLNCAWAAFRDKPYPTDCPDCSGTGRVPDVEATLRAEVARLTEERDTWRSSYLADHAEVSRLTATIAERDGEVARLEGRERAAKPFVMACKEPGEFDTFCGSCWRYWSEDASGCAEDCARSAWLAGCKS